MIWQLCMDDDRPCPREHPRHLNLFRSFFFFFFFFKCNEKGLLEHLLFLLFPLLFQAHTINKTSTKRKEKKNKKQKTKTKQNKQTNKKKKTKTKKKTPLSFRFLWVVCRHQVHTSNIFSMFTTQEVTKILLGNFVRVIQVMDCFRHLLARLEGAVCHSYRQSMSQGRICSDICARNRIQMEVADQACYITQSPFNSFRTVNRKSR